MERMRHRGASDPNEAKILSALLESQNYNRRVLAWFEKHHRGLIIDIVVDNIDCFEAEERDATISHLLPLTTRRNTKVILPLRYATLLESDSRDALHQYGDESELPIYGPGFRSVVQQRLSKLPVSLASAEQRKWDGIMTDIGNGLASNQVVTLFNGVFGDDTRDKLRGVRLLMESPHIPSPRGYGNRNNLLAALMLEHYWIPLPRVSRVLSLFHGSESPGYQNTLIRVRILQLVSAAGPLRVVPGSYVPQLHDANYDPQSGTVTVRVPGVATLSGPFTQRSTDPRNVDAHFRLRKRYGDWRIVDVRIGSVDVTKLFRQQFESLLRSETPEQMIARLRDRNEQLEARNPLDRK